MSRFEATELKMKPISDGLPVRDEFRGEQTFLTYNDKVGSWDISFYESGWELDANEFRLGVTHWLDISNMWPGVIAQVASFQSQRLSEIEAIVKEIAAQPHYTAGGDPDRIFNSLHKRYEHIVTLAEKANVGAA